MTNAGLHDRSAFAAGRAQRRQVIENQAPLRITVMAHAVRTRHFTQRHREWDRDDGGVEMNWRIAGVLACILSVLGCSNDVEAPARKGRITVSTVMGPIQIEDANRDNDRQEFTANLVGADLKATLRVVPAGDGIVTTGGTAELIDESGKVLFSIEATMNKEDGAVTYRQATPDDYLTFSLREENDRMRETYDANGDVASFEYAVLPEETKRRATNLLEHGISGEFLPVEVREYMAQAELFRDYYQPHMTSSIHDSEIGQVLIEILSSQELSKTAGGVGGQRNEFIDSFCSFMTACAAFACNIPGAMPLCIPCTGGVIACAIFDILCQWIPGWN